MRNESGSLDVLRELLIVAFDDGHMINEVFEGETLH